MKKFMERMAQIAYSINLVNGFDTEVELLSWPKQAPASDWVRGLFCAMLPPKFLRQKLPARGHYFFI